MSDLSGFTAVDPTPGPRRQGTAPDPELEALLTEYATTRHEPAAAHVPVPVAGEAFQAPPVAASNAAHLADIPTGFTMPAVEPTVPGPAPVTFDALVSAEDAFTVPDLPDGFVIPDLSAAAAQPEQAWQPEQVAANWPAPLAFDETQEEEPVLDDVAVPVEPVASAPTDLAAPASVSFEDLFETPAPSAEATTFEMPEWSGSGDPATPGDTVFSMPEDASPWQAYEEVEQHSQLPLPTVPAVAVPSVPMAAEYAPFEVAAPPAAPAFEQQQQQQQQQQPAAEAWAPAAQAPAAQAQPAAPYELAAMLNDHAAAESVPQAPSAPQFEVSPTPQQLPAPQQTAQPAAPAAGPQFQLPPQAPQFEVPQQVPAPQFEAPVAVPHPSPVPQAVQQFEVPQQVPAPQYDAPAGVPAPQFEVPQAVPAPVPHPAPAPQPAPQVAVPAAAPVQYEVPQAAPQFQAPPAVPAVPLPPPVAHPVPQPESLPSGFFDDDFAGAAPAPIQVPVEAAIPQQQAAPAQQMPAPAATPAALPQPAAPAEDDPANRLVAEAAPVEARIPLNAVGANLTVNEEWLNQVLRQLVALGISDVHLLMSGARGELRIEGRRDGFLEEIRLLKGREATMVLNLVKSGSRISTGSNRVPGDGRYELEIDNYPYQLRAVVTPLFDGGEKVVLRLPQTGELKPLEHLGFTARNLDAVNNLLAIPGGMTLIAGPMGEGKTTTAHAALMRIGGTGRAVMSLEDPVERALPGVGQVEVNEDIGSGFAANMKYLVRSDFDTLFLGEIRDEATAASAVRISQAGRRVITTIHADDNVTALRKLIQMSEDSALSVLAAVRGVVSQRLVRRLGEGPDGYLGRHPVHEVLTMSSAVKEALVRDESVEAIERAAAATSTTFAENARALVAEGITDEREVRRVLGNVL